MKAESRAFAIMLAVGIAWLVLRGPAETFHGGKETPANPLLNTTSLATMQGETVRPALRNGEPGAARPSLKSIARASGLSRRGSAKAVSQYLPKRLPFAIGSAPLPGPTVPARLEDTYGKLPLRFESNEGQTDHRVQFLSRGQGYTLFLTGDEAVLALQRPGAGRPETASTGPPQKTRGRTGTGADQRALPFLPDPSAQTESLSAQVPEPRAQDVVRFALLGADAQARVAGLDELPGKSNYLIGKDPSQWRTNVPSYAKVRYEDVYPHIDLVYYSGSQQQLEYDFVVQPGGDPDAIRLAVEGGAPKVLAGSSKFEGRAPQLQLLANGDLAIHLDGGDVRLRKPVAYQPDSAVHAAGELGPGSPGRRPADARYVLLADNRVGFQVGSYDPARPLVIDPTLSYSTYFPSSVTGIAVDSTGAAYIVGYTTSATFPVMNPLPAPNNALQGTQDAFVAKLNAAGTALVYATYLGGKGVDQGSGIAVDASGNAYVTGTTSSADFPILNGYQTALGGTSNAFLTELNPAGNALLYSTYLGGTRTDGGAAITLDSTAHAYVAGAAQSTNFPTTPGAYQTSLAGTQNAFVAKFDTTQQGTSSLIYSTYIGGSSYDSAAGVGVDASGNVVVGGATSSTNFPTTSGSYQPSFSFYETFNAGFVTKLNSAGTALVYSTYLGGNSNPYQWEGFYVENFVKSLAVDASGNAYVTGGTNASNFPVNHNYQGNDGCGEDQIFVAKFGPTGTNVYSTYFGGGTYEGLCVAGGNFGYGIAADSSGNAYFTGYVQTDNFPLVNPVQSVLGGGLTKTLVGSPLVSELNSAGSTLLFSSYLGGNNPFESGQAIALDPSGNIYVTGQGYDFPVIAGDYQKQQGVDYNFVAKISPLDTPAISVSPGSVSFFLQAEGTTSASRTVAVRDVSSSPVTVSNIAITGSNASDFSFSNDCAAPVAAASDCGIPVTFTPSIIGPETALLTVTATGATGSPATVTLSGTGASDGVPSLSPATYGELGNVVVGSASAPYTFTLTNTGTGPLGQIVISFPATGFPLLSNDCPYTLAAGANCTFSVAAAPVTTGYLSGKITIANDSAEGTQTIYLYATGVSTPSPTTTSLAVSPKPANSGQTVTLTATVATGYSGTPTGAVTFLDGATALGTGTLDSTGTAVFTTSTLSPGSHSLTASYGGDTNFTGSTSSAVSLTVQAGPQCAQVSGILWAWGQYQYVPGWFSNDPAIESNLCGVADLAAGWNHSLALKGDGTVWAWGANEYGELGNGTASCSPTAVSSCRAVGGTNTPAQVMNLSGVVAVAAGGNDSLALKSDGTVWAWGSNLFGALGDAATSDSLNNNDSTTPVQVVVLSGVTAIAAGYYHNLALKNDGSVWAWGWNGNGQLGNGATNDSNMPVQVRNLTGVIAIAGGADHSMALTGDGKVWAWGGNQYGQLGNGTTTDSSMPVPVSNLTDVIAISAGDGFSLAVKGDGTAWAWGHDGDGELGNGTTNDSSIPVPVSNLTGVTAVAAGANHSLALKSDGTVWGWGYRVSNTPTSLSSATPVQASFPCGIGQADIAAGAYYNLALTSAPLSPAPCITSPDGAVSYEGQALSFAVTTIGSPAPSLSVSGALPSGLMFADNGNGTGTLGGTPATGTAGTYNVTFSALNGITPNATQAFTLTVGTIRSTGTTTGGTTGSSSSSGTSTPTGAGSVACSCTLTGNYVPPKAVNPSQTSAPISAISWNPNGVVINGITVNGVVDVITSKPNGISSAQVATIQPGGIPSGDPVVKITGFKVNTPSSVYNGEFPVVNLIDQTHYQVQNFNATNAQPSSGGTSIAYKDPLQSPAGKYTVTTIPTTLTGQQNYTDISVHSASGSLLLDLGGRYSTAHWDFSSDDDRFLIHWTDPTCTDGMDCTDNLVVYDLSVSPPAMVVNTASSATELGTQLQFSPSGAYLMYLYRDSPPAGTYGSGHLYIYRLWGVSTNDVVYRNDYTFAPTSLAGEDQFGGLGTWGFSPDTPETGFMYAYYPYAGSASGDLYWVLVNLASGHSIQNPGVPATLTPSTTNLEAFWQFAQCCDVAGLVTPDPADPTNPNKSQVILYDTSTGTPQSKSEPVGPSSITLTTDKAGQEAQYNGQTHSLAAATCGKLNTSPGQNIEVQPKDTGTNTARVDLTFSNVSAPAGNTTVTSMSQAPSPATPDGFKLGTPASLLSYYDVTTSVTFSGQVTVCINYGGFTYTNPSAIRLYHYDQTQNPPWVDVTISNNTITTTVCGTVSKLSPFAVFEPAGPVPASITATGGTPQSATVSTAFAAPLQATVTDSGGNPLSGITVTFTAPAVGATGSFAGPAFAFVTTNASGIATAPAFTANGTAGSYAVTATVGGVAAPAVFSLTNTPVPAPFVKIVPAPSSPVSITTDSSGNYIVNFTVINQGNVPINVLSLASTKLGSAALSGVPLSTIINVAAGAGATFTLTFPAAAGAAGAKVAFSASGTYSAGSLSGSWSFGTRALFTLP